MITVKIMILVKITETMMMYAKRRVQVQTRITGQQTKQIVTAQRPIRLCWMEEAESMVEEKADTAVLIGIGRLPDIDGAVTTEIVMEIATKTPVPIAIVETGTLLEAIGIGVIATALTETVVLTKTALASGCVSSVITNRRGAK
jgi:hypothetical protein